MSVFYYCFGVKIFHVILQGCDPKSTYEKGYEKLKEKMDGEVDGIELL